MVFKEVAAAFDALAEHADEATELWTTRQRRDQLDRIETLARMLPALGHELINQLAADATGEELGCKMLTAATERGVVIRFIVGDPDSAAVTQRGEEEQIGSSLAARCHMTLARLQSLVDAAGLEIRAHATPLYTSMFRADDTLIANPHLYGAPASDNPAIFIRRDDAPELWRDHQLAFERVWNTACPIQTRA